MDEGRILRVSPVDQIPTLPGDWEVTCRGRLVWPGRCDCHAHLMAGPLGKTWVKGRELEARLTVAEVESIGAFAMARALRWGITTCVEHLFCPGAVHDGLLCEARAAEALGLRLVISHASSGALGETSALAQLEANADAISALKQSRLIRAALGFDAPSSCGDQQMRRLGELRLTLGVGIHFDLDPGRGGLGSGARAPPGRRSEFGLDLGSAVGFAVDPEDAEELVHSEATVVVSDLGPRTAAWLEQLQQDPVMFFRIGLGSGRAGRLPNPGPAGWEDGSGREAALDRLLSGDPSFFFGELYGGPLGEVQEGYLADLIVFDHVPCEDRIASSARYLIETLQSTPVAWTIVAGKVVVRENQLLGHDYLHLSSEAAKAVRAVRARAGLASEA